MLICVDSKQKEANGKPGARLPVADDGDSRLQGAIGGRGCRDPAKRLPPGTVGSRAGEELGRVAQLLKGLRLTLCVMLLGRISGFLSQTHSELRS